MAATSSVEPAPMRPLLRRCVSFAPLLLLFFLVGDQNTAARTRIPVDMPPLVLWAWDRDDDFSFIDTRDAAVAYLRSEEHTSELQSRPHLVCRLLLEKKKKTTEHISFPKKKKRKNKQ